MKKLSLITGIVLGFMSMTSFGRNSIAAFEQDPSLAKEVETLGLSTFEPWIELTFKKDSSYSYALGVKFIEDNGQTRKVTTSRLYKNGFVVDELTHANIFNRGFVRLDTLYRYVPFQGLNELGELYTSGEFCGAGLSKILFGRSGDKLLKEIIISDEWEGEGVVPGTFTSKEFKLDLVKKELVIETIKGYDYADGKMESNKIYYELSDRCVLKGNEFKFRKVEKPEYFYVVAENGLSMRFDPFLSAPKKGVLLYGEKIRILQVTDLTLSIKDGRNILDGKWVEIEYSDGSTTQTAFVFNGYLSSNKPVELAASD